MMAQEEMITVREAQEILKVSPYKMAQLIKEGLLQTKESVLDKRVRLVSRKAVEELKARGERGE